MARVFLALSVAQLAKYVVADEYGEYPTSYPYQTAVQPGLPVDWTNVPEEMPTFTFDDNDAGGYHWHGHILNSAIPNQPKFKHINDQSPPFAMFPTMMWGGMYYYQTINSWDIFSSLPYNCTAEGMPLIDQAYIDSLKINEVLTAQGVCPNGGCCRNSLGLRARFPDADSRLLAIAQGITAGGCPASIDDETERLFFEMASCDLCLTNTYECNEALISRTERVAVGGCGDAIVDMLMSCQVFVAIGFPEFFPMESQTYLAKLTPSNTISLYIVIPKGDKICHPKSYYMPVGSPSETPSGVAPVGEGSSAMAVKATFMIVVAIMFLA